MKPLDDPVPDQHDDRGHHGDGQVRLISQHARGHVADQDVPQQPATEGRHEPEHEDADGVEALASAERRARQREHEDPAQVEDALEREVHAGSKLSRRA